MLNWGETLINDNELKYDLGEYNKSEVLVDNNDCLKQLLVVFNGIVIVKFGAVNGSCVE